MSVYVIEKKSGVYVAYSKIGSPDVRAHNFGIGEVRAHNFGIGEVRTHNFCPSHTKVKADAGRK